MLSWVSQEAFSMAMACCTTVMALLKSWVLVASPRWIPTATLGSTSARFCAVSLATRKSLGVSGTMKEAVEASRACSAWR